MPQHVLAIDIGGTNVKCRVESDAERRAFPSGPTLTPEQMVDGVKKIGEGWSFDVITIGLPAPILGNRASRDPANLGPGWMDFDYAAAFGRPVKLINDAAMQAVGSYEGGRMLFLGLGTGLGSCFIADHLILPMELAHLPYRKGKEVEQFVGVKALKKLGKKEWTRDVHDVIKIFSAALLPDYVVLGGGNSVRLKTLPENCRLGANANAFIGGFRLWTPEWAKSVVSMTA
ncbi:MAG: ROK family protein [Phycisphaerales bacterium]|nr:ROK family protein [Phycisphaerales bacterium]